MADMKQQLDLLYELQQVDTGIGRRQQALAKLDDGTEATAKLNAAKTKAAAFKKKQQQIDTAFTDKELHLKSTEEEQGKHSKQAYGGTISDPKQLRALEKKIEELGRLKDRLEEELLELMEQSEKVSTAVTKQQQAVEELDRRATTARERHTQESARLHSEVNDLSAKRDQVASQIDGAMMKQYEALRAKMDGVAVGAVKLGTCTACRVRVPSTYAGKLKSRDELVRCESCRRILYLPEGESPYAPEEDI